MDLPVTILITCAKCTSKFRAWPKTFKICEACRQRLSCLEKSDWEEIMDLIVLDVVCIKCGVEFCTVDQTQKKCTKCQQLHRVEAIELRLKEEKLVPYTNFVGGGE